MSVDTDSGETAIETVDRLASELGEAIADLPEHEEFRQAKAAVEADEDVQEQIATFERKREDFQRAKQRGEATELDRRELEAAHQELQSLPVMETYLQAQSALERRLGRVDTAISAELAVDFGEKAGGCCQH
ncbi:YlbF family regulator [Halorhabdus sp. CBA1104]|uniref:YlbF family regulator n=1 Tax=unclassified Halorhabdus TaxID=2621901 RepID=UPI0012B30413|nr:MULTISPECIES: YlbF family regulator [unclassified Halorhabdus]QGN06978.1 YlbF family regulator [Halorhabdus sp. CBA1104]